MTTVFWDVCSEKLTGPDDAREWLAEQLEMYNPQGTRAITVWLGPEGGERAEAPLRLDLDPDTGRAAARWLPDGLVADGEPGEAIRVCESAYRELVKVPGEIARVDLQTALAVAVEYAGTGHRPAAVEWVPAPSERR